MNSIESDDLSDSDDSYNYEDNDLSVPTIPPSIFSEFEELYEKNSLIVQEEHARFKHFIEGIFKIQNLSLLYAFS